MNNTLPAGAEEPVTDDDPATEPPVETGSVTDELQALVSDGRTYVEAELAFQKSRAGVVGKFGAKTAVYAILALFFLQIAFIGLIVGIILILIEPLGVIWATVTGVIGALVLVALFGLLAKSQASRIAKAFDGDRP